MNKAETSAEHVDPAPRSEIALYQSDDGRTRVECRFEAESIWLTQAQMAPLMGMSLSGYRKWEQGQRRVSGPAAALLRVIEKEPGAVQRALAG